MASETRKLNFLRYAKIKVRGLEGAFMDPIMAVLCQGLRVYVGIFPIPSPRRQIEGGSSIELVTRAITAKVATLNFGNIGHGMAIKTT